MRTHGWTFGVGMIVSIGLISYVAAEDLTLSTYYPSPRGVYNQIRVGVGTPPTTPDPLTPNIGAEMRMSITGGNLYMDNVNWNTRYSQPLHSTGWLVWPRDLGGRSENARVLGMWGTSVQMYGGGGSSGAFPSFELHTSDGNYGMTMDETAGSPRKVRGFLLGSGVASGLPDPNTFLDLASGVQQPMILRIRSWGAPSWLASGMQLSFGDTSPQAFFGRPTISTTFFGGRDVAITDNLVQDFTAVPPRMVWEQNGQVGIGLLNVDDFDPTKPDIPTMVIQARPTYDASLRLRAATGANRNASIDLNDSGGKSWIMFRSNWNHRGYIGQVPIVGMSGNPGDMLFGTTDTGSSPIPLRMKITGDTGFVAIGVPNNVGAWAQLHIMQADPAAVAPVLRIDDQFNPLLPLPGDDTPFVIDANGNVGIGTANPALGEKVQIIGNTTIGAPPPAVPVNLSVWGQILRNGTVLPDFVFQPDYKLPSIEQHAAEMWAHKHLPAIAPSQEKGTEPRLRSLDDDFAGLLQELEYAHRYIEQLNIQLQSQQQRIATLEETVNRLVQQR